MISQREIDIIIEVMKPYNPKKMAFSVPTLVVKIQKIAILIYCIDLMNPLISFKKLIF